MRLWATGVLAVCLTACSPLHGAAPDCFRQLVIREFPAGNELARYPLADHAEFSLSFIHSVSHTPVRDDYVLTDDGEILQTMEVFHAHGAGLPSQSDEPQVESWEQRDGKFWLRMKRPIEHLVVRTDRNYRNRLHLKSQVVNLNQWPNQALEFTLEPCGDHRP